MSEETGGDGASDVNDEKRLNHEEKERCAMMGASLGSGDDMKEKTVQRWSNDEIGRSKHDGYSGVRERRTCPGTNYKD